MVGVVIKMQKIREEVREESRVKGGKASVV